MKIPAAVPEHIHAIFRAYIAAGFGGNWSFNSAYNAKPTTAPPTKASIATQ